MAKSCNQKAKILYLERMLWETDENRTLAMQDILTKLESYGIHAERKSIYDDMETLRFFGMNIQFRRGREGGYYLGSGERPDEALICMPENKEIVMHEENTEPDLTVNPKHENLYGQKMKLYCSNSIREEIEHTFGAECTYKEKDEDGFTVTVRVSEDSRFYGWLASMGKNVHLLKPKTTAAAYRNYLKGIAKAYKGIENK